MSFAARFDDRCASPDCAKPIRAGDQVAYVDQDLMHEACTSAGELPAPITRAVCGTCFTEVSVSGGCMC